MAWDGQRLCKGLNRDGTPCGGVAVTDGDYCFRHDEFRKLVKDAMKPKTSDIFVSPHKAPDDVKDPPQDEEEDPFTRAVANTPIVLDDPTDVETTIETGLGRSNNTHGLYDIKNNKRFMDRTLRKVGIATTNLQQEIAFLRTELEDVYSSPDLKGNDGETIKNRQRLANELTRNISALVKAQNDVQSWEEAQKKIISLLRDLMVIIEDHLDWSSITKAELAKKVEDLRIKHDI